MSVTLEFDIAAWRAQWPLGHASLSSRRRKIQWIQRWIALRWVLFFNCDSDGSKLAAALLDAGVTRNNLGAGIVAAPASMAARGLLVNRDSSDVPLLASPSPVGAQCRRTDLPMEWEQK